MRKFLVFIILMLCIGFSVIRIASEKVKEDLAVPIAYPTGTIAPSVTIPNKANGPEVQSIFVPYWSLKDPSTGSGQEKTYDTYIFFGVTPTKIGINTKESGALALDKFLAFAPNNKKKLLAIRMIQADTNFAILKDQDAQKRVITETIALAKEKQFNGLVLDLEVSAIPFESIVQQINGFTKLFYQEAKKNKLSFALTMYGDVFYRVRPFDVKELAQNTDEIMIMAYDFSKAKGDPGPNFPLQGRTTYGYDYEKMTEDFLQVVPANKLTVVFGMFGYDWLVNDQKKSTQQGEAISTQEIEASFITACHQKSCAFKRDPHSLETEVTYTDKAGHKHTVWFEDLESVAAKKAYLKTQGINSFSYWAHSYF